MKVVRKYGWMLFILLILSINVISISDYAHAKARRVYLTDFVLENRIGNQGFSNTLSSESASYEATVAALEILDYYNLFEVPCWFGEHGKWWGALHYHVNRSSLGSNMESVLKDLIDNKNENLYTIYQILKVLAILDESISTTLETSIESYITTLEYSDGGFSSLGNTTNPNIVATYHSLMVLTFINKNITNLETHLNWTKKCLNSDGGFGGTIELSSTLTDTYYAISILSEFGDLSDLSPAKTIEYVRSLGSYADTNPLNLGGFFPDSTAQYPLISSTLHAIETLFLLDETSLTSQEKSATINWILNRQNINDGGFVDLSEGVETKSSSIMTSWKAFRTLGYLDQNLLKLEQDIWMVEFNYWILVILLASIGVAVSFIIFIYRRRKI